MPSYAQLEDLETILFEDFGWREPDEFEGGGELALFLDSNPELDYKVYVHDKLPGVQLALIGAGTPGAMAYLENEYRNVEAKCELSSQADVFDYAEFIWLLEDALYERD